MKSCFARVRSVLPNACVEVRIDSAFFGQTMVQLFSDLGTEFSISVPFHRFVDLKELIEARTQWNRLNSDVSYFELSWKPKSWRQTGRFLVVRTRTAIRQRGPVQLDLFVPQEYGYEFKVIVTNKRTQAHSIAAFHNGRGAQEAIFAELKSQGQLGYVPTRKWIANQVFLLASVLAHNLCRELQMATRPKDRRTTAKRTPLWQFEKLATIRQHLLQRAGRLIRPQGRSILSMNADKAVKNELVGYLHALEAA